jgi:hypothetical protein
MKNTIRLAAFTILLILQACGGTNNGTPSTPANNGKLTVEKAEEALNRWVNDGQVSVRGIQDLPRDNAAQADITFTNFRFTLQNQVQQRNYSGPGTAVFTHYTDGRWVLTRITTGSGVLWNDLSVEVY